MAKSVLNKSLKLFEDDIAVATKYSSSKDKNAKRRKISGIQSKKLSVRDGKQYNTILLRKKAETENKTLENLKILEKLNKKELDRNSSTKILNYQLIKSHKLQKNQEEKKDTSTIFTDEDFEKFEREYFAKHK